MSFRRPPGAPDVRRGRGRRGRGRPLASAELGGLGPSQAPFAASSSSSRLPALKPPAGEAAPPPPPPPASPQGHPAASALFRPPPLHPSGQQGAFTTAAAASPTRPMPSWEGPPPPPPSPAAPSGAKAGPGRLGAGLQFCSSGRRRGGARAGQGERRAASPPTHIPSGPATCAWGGEAGGQGWPTAWPLLSLRGSAEQMRPGKAPPSRGVALRLPFSPGLVSAIGRVSALPPSGRRTWVAPRRGRLRGSRSAGVLARRRGGGWVALWVSRGPLLTRE